MLGALVLCWAQQREEAHILREPYGTQIPFNTNAGERSKTRRCLSGTARRTNWMMAIRAEKA